MTNYRNAGMRAEVFFACEAEGSEPAAPELLASAIAGYDLGRFLRTLGTIASDLTDAYDSGRESVEYQLSLAERLNHGNPVPTAVRQGLRNGTITCITSPSQLANIALFGVANRPFSGIARPLTMLRILGLFNYCSLRDPSTNGFYMDPASIANAFAVATSHVDRFYSVLHRYVSFIEWSKSADHTAGIDVAGAFERGAGFSLVDYAKCVVALNRYFNPAVANVTGMPRLRRDQISDTAAPLMHWLGRRSMSPEDVDQLLSEHPMETLRNIGHFRVLEKPFVQWEDSFYLLNPRALDNALGVGLFFAPIAAGANAVDYFALAGRFFEAYVGQFLQAIASRSGTLFHPEVLDEAGRKSTDFFILEGDALNFFKVRFGRIARPAIESMDAAKIDESFEALIYSKAHQLDRNVRAFAADELHIPGVSRKSVTRICPVIVLPNPFPRSPSVQAKIDADLAARGLLPPWIADINIAPLEIVEAESLEGLDGLREPVCFSDLIIRKTTDPTTRHTFFKNFLLDHEHLVFKMSDVDQKRRAAWLSQLRLDTQHWIA